MAAAVEEEEEEGWSVGRLVGWMVREGEWRRRWQRHPTSSSFFFLLLLLLISAKPLSRECLTPFEPQEMPSERARTGGVAKNGRRLFGDRHKRLSFRKAVSL